MQILTNNHYDKIMELFDSATNEIRIISPFLSESMARKLCSVVKEQNVKCVFITRLYLEDIFAKANSLDALEMMLDAGIEVFALKGLHTKLYLFDTNYGVLGSANFTAGGFISNIELSLLLESDDTVLPELHSYFDDLLSKIKACKNGLITKSVLSEARLKYQYSFSSKKSGTGISSSYMYGAVIDRNSRIETPDDIIKELNLCQGEQDIVNEAFRRQNLETEIVYNHTIWLKFDGEGDDRLASDEEFPMVDVKVGSGIWYLSNYPFNVRSVKEDDEVYLAAITTDLKGKNEPVIVGRGHLAAYSDTNKVSDEWIKIYPWMKRYPYYCVIKDAAVLKAPVKYGVPMDELWDKLGSDTYISSFGKQESISEVAKKHFQKAHLRLSGNAKQYIDQRLDELEKQYGMRQYISDI